MPSASSSKIATGNFSPKGTVPNLGILVAWRINGNITGYFTTSSSQYALDRISVTIWASPKQSVAAGNGSVSWAATEKIDSENSVKRNSTSSFWSAYETIWDSNTFVYETCQGYPNKTFIYDASEVLDIGFYNSNAVNLYPTTGTITLSISGPK